MEVDVGRRTWGMGGTGFRGRAAGNREKARDALRKLTDANKKEELDPGVFVFANRGVGDNEQAIAWLQKGYEKHSAVLADYVEGGTGV